MPFIPQNFAMVKKYWSICNEEIDINKKIVILEKSLKHGVYIPNFILLGKYYSILGKIHQINSKYNVNQREKNYAEDIFKDISSIIEKNNRICFINNNDSIYRHEIHNHNLYYEWGEHYRRWEEFNNAKDKLEIAINEIDHYGRYVNETDKKIKITCKIFIAMCYTELNRFDEAREIFNYIEMNENPNHPYLLTGLGEYYMRLPIIENNENINQAEKYFKKAISIQPNNYYPYWCLSKLYIQKKDYNKALDCLNRAHQKVQTSDNIINKKRIEKEINGLVLFSAGQL